MKLCVIRATLYLEVQHGRFQTFKVTQRTSELQVQSSSNAEATTATSTRPSQNAQTCRPLSSKH